MIVVHLENNQEIKFTRCVHGLYYFVNANTRLMDMPKHKITNNETIDKYKISDTRYSFVSTVASNKEYFTQQEIEGADNARLMQGRIGFSSDQDYMR